MSKKCDGQKVAIFFCQRVDADQDVNRRSIEREIGSRIRFFPLPCSGRIEPLHLMRAIESGSDKVYIVTCPEGACKHREGNTRARKRVFYTQGILEEMGLEKDTLEVICLDAGTKMTIDALARDLLARHGSQDTPSVKESAKPSTKQKRNVQGVGV